MYNAYRSGMPANVPTFSERAAGSHFGGAPAAAFNPGPRSGAGMSIFSSIPSGELMTAASDDSLFAPAVAPVTRAYAVVPDVSDDHCWLPKGSVVQVSDFAASDQIKDPKTIKKAERAGHNLKRLLCTHCSKVSDYKKAHGVVGVLAEAVDVGKKARSLHEGFVVITLAIENAAEVYVPPEGGSAKTNIGWTANLKKKVPSQTITLQARKDLGRFRVATVLAPWSVGDAVGIHACLHPQIFVTEPTMSSTEKLTAVRTYTQARMRTEP